eukprot:9466451-Pyramimonas_sp.AAC.1
MWLSLYPGRSRWMAPSASGLDSCSCTEKRTSTAGGPRRFHAENGKPSGPGAVEGALSMASRTSRGRGRHLGSAAGGGP